jgi:hypothetical protein
MKRSLLTAFLLVSLAASFGLAPVQAQPPPLIDHYLIYYTAQQFPVMPGQVALIDQFVSIHPDPDFTMGLFGNPVDKNGEGIIDPQAHLTGYRFNPFATDEFIIGVHDQFGYNVWRVKDPYILLLPALKNEHGEPPHKDHYMCYRVVEGPILNLGVQLIDQWHAGHYVLGQAILWCNPVEKVVNGIPYPIINPGHHLAVYNFANAPDIPIVHYMFLDQFMMEYNESFTPFVLAVPAAKQFPVPVKESTWGHIKSLYR